MPYQSFDGPADSDSQGKLAALHLPPLAGKRFLGLGCNEGFFCGRALAETATRVVGIDSNDELIRSARRRFPAAESRCASWWDLPDEPFDVMLMASALHCERNPLELCRRIRSRLPPGGLFVLECGVVTDWVQPAWIETQRCDCAPKEPTLALLRDHIQQDFAVRHVGPSVAAPGDCVARHVFHCHAFEPTVFVVRGRTGTGKTVLSTELANHGLPVVDVDLVMFSIASDATGHTGGVFDLVKERTQGHLVASLYREMCRDAGHAQQLANHLCGFLPEYTCMCARRRDPRGRRVLRAGSRGRRRPGVRGVGAHGRVGHRTGPVRRSLERRGACPCAGQRGWRLRVSASAGRRRRWSGGACVPRRADPTASWSRSTGCPTARSSLIASGPDLCAAGIGSGAHAFEIDLGPLPPCDTSRVSVWSSDLSRALTGADCSIAELKARLRGR